MKGHTHACERCQAKFPCAGELVRNWDGWPETICLDYHEGGDKHHALRQCETCALTCWCANCGAHPATVEHDGDRICGTCADEQRATT